MKIMLIGSGGREHALAWKLAQSDRVAEIIAVPGNPGIAREPKCRCLPMEGFEVLAEFAQAHAVDLTVVGPEGPLVEGIADHFRTRDLVILGPGRTMAALEGSKAFAKEFMTEYGVATAAYARFDDLTAALAYIEDHRYPLVVKASGVCAGKGVIICADRDEASVALTELMAGQRFSGAGSTVVIEECLTGPEVSILALYDGHSIIAMESAMDHKRAFDGDQGPNTGGMGTVSPAPYFTAQAQADFDEHILQPTLAGLKDRGMRDPACIFFGLMLTPQGARLLEYNMRFGDPETQSVLLLLESDLADVFEKTVQGRLSSADLVFADETAVCVIGAAQGYPEAYAQRIPLTFPEDAAVKIFMAGVAQEGGQLVSSGGRIFGAAARGDETARIRILDYMEHFRELPIFWRRDIGSR